MNSVRLVYMNFWGSFLNNMNTPPTPIPAYQEGYAVAGFNANNQPIRPQFPYITYEIARPAFGRFTIVTASIWDRNVENPGFHGIVDDVLRQVQERIPEGGLILKLDDGSGAIWLQRNRPNFLAYKDDPSDHTITRGIIFLIVRSHLI